MFCRFGRLVFVIAPVIWLIVTNHGTINEKKNLALNLRMEAFPGKLFQSSRNAK